MVGPYLLGLATQHEALSDPEAVLLVDYRERQPLKLDAFLNEGMRTDDQLRLAGFHALQNFLFLGRRETAMQPRDAHSERLEPLAELAPVLLRQDFGGRHDGGLAAGLHGREAGNDGHHSLAAAHVALQQSVHRLGPADVVQHLVHRPHLRASQLER